MKVVICIKPVLGKYVDGTREGKTYKMNPYDMFALETILKKRKECGFNFQIVCISMASYSAINVLRQARSMGSDEVILINDPSFSGSDTYATSYILAKAIKKIGDVNFVICGEKTVDGETGQVFWQLTERLNYIGVKGVVEIQQIDNYSIKIVTIEGDKRKTIKCNYPLSISFLGYQPYTELINLRTMRKAMGERIEVLDAKTLDIELSKCGNIGSKTRVLKTKNLFSKREQKIIQGNLEKKVEFIMKSIYQNKEKYER